MRSHSSVPMLTAHSTNPPSRVRTQRPTVFWDGEATHSQFLSLLSGPLDRLSLEKFHGPRRLGLREKAQYPIRGTSRVGHFTLCQHHGPKDPVESAAPLNVSASACPLVFLGAGPKQTLEADQGGYKRIYSPVPPTFDLNSSLPRYHLGKELIQERRIS